MPSLATLKEVVRPYYLRWIYFPFTAGARPSSFRSCWHGPNGPIPDSSDLVEGALTGHGCGVAIYPMVDWHTRIQRPQQLARGLACLGHPVLFVNPHLGRQFSKPKLFDNNNRVAVLEDNILEVHIRLAREPVFHERMLTHGESGDIALAMGQMAQTAKLDTVVQIVSLPIWMDTALQLRREKGWPIIYDCHDHLAGLPRMAAGVVAAEHDALESADRVLFSSQDLVARHSSQAGAGKGILLPNATGPGATPLPAASRTQTRRRQVAGYVGALSSWFDNEAVEKAATMNPNADFMIVGGIEEQDLTRLKALPNIIFLGEVPHADLPDLFSQFDIALIPFLLNDLTRATDPIKLYEYFSYGLPVVSTKLPEVERFGDLVYLASGPEDFGVQVSNALAEQDESRREQRFRIADEESWSARALVLERQMEDVLTGFPTNHD